MDVSVTSSRVWPLRLRAWSVHLFTGLGVVAGFLTLLAIADGQARQAVYFGLVSCVIDSLDGTLARRWQVKKWLPEFDGRKLDDIIDYLTYVFIPMYFAYRFALIPPAWTPLLCLVLLASAYRFCDQSAKTHDGYFTGFPSYWNFMVLYFYLLGSPPLVNALVMLFWAIMVFVPIKYIYPSRTTPLYPLTLALTVLAGVVNFLIVLNFDHPSPWLLALSLLYWVYYFVLSFYLNWRDRHTR